MKNLSLTPFPSHPVLPVGIQGYPFRDILCKYNPNAFIIFPCPSFFFKTEMIILILFCIFFILILCFWDISIWVYEESPY